MFINKNVKPCKTLTMYFPRNSARLPSLPSPISLLLAAILGLSAASTGLEVPRGREAGTRSGTDQALYGPYGQKERNFIVVEMSQTRRQVAIKFDPVWARETVTTTRSPEGDFVIDSVRREISDGSAHHIVSLYDEHQRLVRCQTRRDQEADDFLNSTDDMATHSFSEKDKVLCVDASKIDMHVEINRSLKPSRHEFENATESTISCFYFDRPAELPQSVRGMLDFASSRSECRRLRGQFPSMTTVSSSSMQSSANFDVALASDFDTNVTSIGRRSHNRRQDRSRRSLFIYPGTLWCGLGNRAKSIYALGEHAFTDRCCREHDVGCPEDKQIDRLVTKYYLTNNIQPFTISHCACEKRFHKCLRQVRNAISYRVGDIYFNKLDAQCFVLRPRMQCVEKGWWGKCYKYEKRETAVLRRTRRFPTTLARNRTKPNKDAPEL